MVDTEGKTTRKGYKKKLLIEISAEIQDEVRWMVRSANLLRAHEGTLRETSELLFLFSCLWPQYVAAGSN